MKNLAFLLVIITFLLTSCGKEEIKPMEIKEKEKAILEVRAASEYPLVLKSAESYIGVEYYKDYRDKDIVTATINGQPASLISEVTENHQLLPSLFTAKILFKLPKIVEVGDFKINISIKNNQNTINGEGTIRIVNDYSVNTVWNSLDRAYISTRYFYMNRFKNGEFGLQQIAFTSDNEFFLGYYTKNSGNLNIYEDRLFIPGLPGKYTIIYDGNNIQQIKTNNGDKIIDQYFDVTKFYADLTSIYGAGTTLPQANNNNNKVTVFKSGDLKLTVTETEREINTIVTKL